MKNVGISVLLMTFLFFPYKGSTQLSYEAIPFGGKSALNKLIQTELQYPANALNLNKNGYVSLSFTINPDGSVKDISISQSSDKIFDKEALRLGKLICWEPAAKSGVSQLSEKEILIQFDCKKYKKWVRKRGYDLIEFPKNIDTSNHIYHIKELDIAPQAVFEEKDVTLLKFFKKEFHYPEEALKLNLSGIVDVQFVVEPTGHITNMRTLTTVGGGCTEEAIRLVSLLNWQSGIKNGKAVRTMINFPVNFNLSNSGEYKTPMAQGSTLFY